jgi:hypothetical protein
VASPVPNRRRCARLIAVVVGVGAVLIVGLSVGLTVRSSSFVQETGGAETFQEVPVAPELLDRWWDLCLPVVVNHAIDHETTPHHRAYLRRHPFWHPRSQMRWRG